ncbi:DUF3987 domain-containing protein [Kibdelosporangium philippinense]|uniref:DUF3987 domain-containing protein n=1 Tax=Kibdelosporangium philippinense TaxID=211113 RepID=A0ABS8ZEY0_9PSEU|nr:DUF3987 domain-containing protein [Kibdelosporangium philippinense]MCE7005470.1 DUF3987 domain-containing protein [Kibdelosporangium philippinense]
MTHANTTPPNLLGSGPTGTRRLYPVRVPEPADADVLATRADDLVARARLWLPPADPAVFDCYLGRLAAQLDPGTEADPIGVMVSLLAAAGVHLGPGPHLQIGYERHPLLVWPILIGQTARGKKGTAHNAAIELLTHADNEFVASNVQSGLSSGEGLAAVFATDPDSGKSGRARLLPDGDCRLLAYEPEWASVMARMKREGNTLSATLRAAWEGGNLSTLNVDARVARRAHVGILAHITPKEFKAKVSASDMAGGTYNRFLPIAVAQSKLLYTPTVADPALLVDLGASLADRLRHGARFGPVGLSHAGTAQWRHIYLEFADHPEEEDSQITEFISRAAPQCLRIAAIYAALDRTDQIGPDHLTAAAALVRYAIASATAVIRPNAALRSLFAYIADAGPEGRTKKDITAGHFRGNAKRNGIDPDALLDELVTAGRITRDERPRPGGGRSTEVYTAAGLT